MNIYQITYDGAEYEVTAGNIQDAISQFILPINTRRRIDLITKIELI